MTSLENDEIKDFLASTGPCTKLTMKLIEKCILEEHRTQAKTENEKAKVVEKLLEATVLRLDWQNIGVIDNLDCFTHVRELYLQYNRIKTIENLECLRDLTFLALSNNQISKVENLDSLTNLEFLDLSNNCIADFNLADLPASLMILRIAGNPCALDSQLPKELFSSLPNLVQVDTLRRDGSQVEIGPEVNDVQAEIPEEDISDALIEELQLSKQKLLSNSISQLDAQQKTILNDALATLMDRKSKMLAKVKERTIEEVEKSIKRSEQSRQEFENWKITQA